MCHPFGLCASLEVGQSSFKNRPISEGKTIAKQFSGEVLVARGDDVLILGDYGRSGHKYILKNNNLFRFPVGAIDEQFVALAVLQLEEQGKIKLAASICDYLSNCRAIRRKFILSIS